MNLKGCLFLFALLHLFASCKAEKICETKDGSTVYDPVHNVCLIKPNFSCHRYSGIDCVPNAVCDYNTEKVCKCRIGFYENSEDQCVHGVSETCMTNKDCDADKGLECRVSKGRCECPFPDQLYDREAKKCLVKLGRNCSGALGCESNFVCRNETCLCPEGLDLTKTSEKCSSGLGKVCEKQEDCDISRLLLCIHGTCNCQHPLQEYSAPRGMCVGLEGAHCNRTSNASLGQEYYPQENLFCVEGTSCQPIVGSYWIGMCKAEEYTYVMQQLFLAFMICFVEGLFIFLITIFLEQRRIRGKSYHAPVKNDEEDCETATTTTLISCAHEYQEPMLTPLPNTTTTTSIHSETINDEQKEAEEA